jgi:hypothetical protein
VLLGIVCLAVMLLLLVRRRWKAALSGPFLFLGALLLYLGARWVAGWMLSLARYPEDLAKNPGSWALLIGAFAGLFLIPGWLLTRLGWQLLSPVRENLGLPPGED